MADVEQQHFLAAVRDETARLFQAPRIELGLIAFNAVMVALGWWLLPISWRDWLFDNLHGPMAFAIVLETWMLSDVTSTNLLGHDAEASRRAIVDGTLTRLLQVKILVLGSLIGLIAAATALIIAVLRNAVEKSMRLLPVLIVMPIGLVAVCSLLGVAAPYRQRSLVWRWRNRSRWLMMLRWGGLSLTPYLLVSVLATGFLYPAKRMADAITGWNHQGRPPQSTTILMAWIVAAQGLTAVLVMPRIATWLARTQRKRLLAHFNDPNAG